ncbi:hypothetical protein CLTEP_27520 [Clostridium tepidiprofundi DSM 19306]|uniref:Uncharacterized protein n=1 Tax=Clostridium tepidiprofundi DSM 19306 TaxID=1121338 RepID=A0A151AMI8_9CLOT|nr:hypothetical protein CLTEP_27520 [Clostridium tepidiprofundi DSM 19306]
MHCEVMEFDALKKEFDELVSIKNLWCLRQVKIIELQQEV